MKKSKKAVKPKPKQKRSVKFIVAMRGVMGQIEIFEFDSPEAAKAAQKDIAEIPLDRLDANARMIAAAPEMFEALKGLFAASPHDMSDMLEAFRAWKKHAGGAEGIANEKCDRFGAALCKAQQAIAKATGVE